MQRRSDLIGRKIVSLDRGSELDRVRDLVVDRARNRVVALLLQRGRWLHSPRVVELGAVQSFGADAVMVSSAASISDVDCVPDVRRALERNAKLNGTKVLSSSGKQLGFIRDMQFDEHSGAVAAFEISQGLMDEAFHHRQLLPTEGQLVLGADAVIVSAEAERGMLEREEAQDAEIVDDSRPHLAEAAGDYLPQEENPFLPPHKTLGDYVRESMHEAGRAASELWESAKHTAGELSEQAHDAVEEQRIRRALGLRVDRDIFADDGRPVLLRGQIITPLAVAQARTAGVLEKMLHAATAQPIEPTTQSQLIVPGDD